MRDATELFLRRVPDDLKAAVEGLSLLRQHFGRETISAAIGEVSELLVARVLGGTRTRRGSFGHDIRLHDGTAVEVKARIINRYGDSTQFNFGRHTALTHEVFCLAWEDHGSAVGLSQVLAIETTDLLARFGCSQPHYCARTTLGKLRALIG